MRPFGSKSDGKTLQLVQRGTDKRIPVELVKQPSGEVLDPAELEGLHVMVSSENGMGIATIPYAIEDGKLVVEVTADISRQLGLGVYTMTATGRIPDPAYADGYHDYEIVVELCKVAKYGSNDTPVKVTANVLEGLKGDTGLSAYELAVRDGYQGTLQEWLKSIVGKDGADAYEVAKKAGYTGSREEWLKTLIGATGLSAYELAKSEGYKGSLTEWLASLKGEKGDSAYEVAVSEGYTGDKQAWLASIKGEKGDNAYTSYLATTTDSTPMTEKQWSNANDFFYQFIFRILKGAGVQPTETDMTADQVYELDRQRREIASALRSYGLSVSDTDGLDKFAEIIREGVVPRISLYKVEMFYQCKDRILPPLKIWGGWSAPTFAGMFRDAKALTSLPQIDGCERVVSMLNMCLGDVALRGDVVIPTIGVCVSVESAFMETGISSIEIGDMPVCTTIRNLLRSCPSVKSAKIGDAPKCVNAENAFAHCSSLAEVTMGTTGTLMIAGWMFHNCQKLQRINGVVDLSEVTANINTIFTNCLSLEEVRIKGLKSSLDLSSCAKLSLESVRYLFDNLQEVSGQRIDLSRAILDANEETLGDLGDTASDKGWTINYK